MNDLIRYKKISEGLAVYLPNKQSRTYWARVRLSKKDIKKSTNTRVLKEAIEQAYMIRAEIQNRVRNGKPVTASKTINAISSGFLAYVEQTQAESTKKSIFRYFDRYLMVDWKNRPVDEIKASDILKLYDLHDMHETKIGKYVHLMLKRLFDYLEFEDFLNKEQRPSIPKPKAKQTESFELFKVDELDCFLNAFKEKSDYYENIYLNSKTDKNRKNFERYLIANCYYNLLAKTGARAGFEINKIKFEDLIIKTERFGGAYFSWEKFDLKIKNGKMSKKKGFRQIPAPMGFAIEFDRLCNLLYEKDYCQLIKEYPEKYIFSYSKSNKIVGDLEEIFNEVREELREKNKIRKNTKFVPYSFRHTYITFALAQKIDIYLLALNCGTSTHHIEKTYSKLAASMRSDEIYKINLFKDLKDKSL